MTLGDAGRTAVRSATRRARRLPVAADTWTMGESDVDDDVLAAYLASRQRAG